MPFYNLAAEFASLLVICVSMISFLLDDNKVSTRYRALKWLYFTTFFSIVITIGSLLTTDYYTQVPVVLTDVFKYLYFLTVPIAAPMALYYSITLTYHKNYKLNFIKEYIWAWLPYAIYCLIIVTNGIHRLIFTISSTEGYIRGDFFRITYFIAFIYFALIIYFTAVNIRTPQRTALLIVCLNLLISTVIFCAQLIIPSVQLSGVASVCGILIMHFYVQNVSKFTDPLTELYNRQTLTIVMTRLCKSQTPFSLVVYSLRNFKGVNERNGLQVGDEILEQFALRLRGMYPGKYLHRYSGDEFAILIPASDKAAHDKLESCFKKIGLAFILDKLSFTMNIVQARVDYPEFGMKTEELISAMDYSISTIKKNQGDTNQIYDISVCERMKRRHYIIERLKHAIENNGFEAYYQPIFSANNNDFSMAEALIRFRKSDEPFVSPGEFIPIAEDTGMIIKITRMMIELVCADYQKLLDRYGDKLKVKSISINFPYVMFMKKNAVDDVLKIVSKYNISPSMIKLELTERTFSSDLNKTIEVMGEFIKNGFIFELDDFGVEYSNFSMFFSVPIKIVKFDRSLVINATSTEERKGFFKQFLEGVKELDIEVVMEGVEDEELLNFLIACKSDYIQGFVFSKPLTLSEFDEFIHG